MRGLEGSEQRTRRPGEAITGGKGARACLRRSGAEVRGELISAEGVNIWLLRDDGRLVNFPVESVRDACLGVFQTREAELTAWTIVGALSTVSHGAYLIFSLPIWLLVGIPSASSNQGAASSRTRSIPGRCSAATPGFRRD